MGAAEGANQDKVRLAIVGAGKIAEIHLPAALSSHQIEVVAIVDPALERGQRLADDFEIRPRIAKSVEDVVADIDAAVVATPNHTHHAISMACISAGVHILIEKPLATTWKDGDAMVRAAEARQTVAAVGYFSRFRPVVDQLKELLRSEYFGKPKRFVYQFGARGGWTPASNYILDQAAVGGGVTVVNGTHFLDRMLHWFGYPDQISYRDDACGGPEANSYAEFTYRSEDGEPLRGTVRLSKTVQLPAGFVLETTEGIVTLMDRFDAQIVFRPHRDPRVTHLIKPDRVVSLTERELFRLQLEDFAEACRGLHPPKVSALDGLDSLRLLEAMYAARTDLNAIPDVQTATG